MKANLSAVSCAIATILLLSGCIKAKPELPAETHTGANTMGFTGNGNNYTASGRISNFATISGVDYNSFALNGDNVISFTGRSNANEGSFQLLFSITYQDAPGTYPINNATFISGSQPADDAHIFTTSGTHTGTVTVTHFDGTFSPYNPGTILSGTFDIELANSAGKTIHLSNGRFDISGL